MKLSESKPNVEVSSNMESHLFSIQDQGMIFDILRNKMYSNTILAICREISCNARDAHREVGKDDVPIAITLPNSLEPFYKIKDFGPGISPDRMVNIFIKYTASTKRDDNVQTGGFGLGAKTPFSYSDTFTIETIVDGIKYNYACFIDETKVGKLMLLSQAPTSEENGTEIIIPVKNSDFTNFNIYTKNAVKHWKVKPIIKGSKIDFDENKTLLKGKNWEVIYSKDYYSRASKIIIDGIEYPLDIVAAKQFSNTSILESTSGSVFLYFNIGELSLSANREQIYFDKQTKDKISKALESMSNEIKDLVNVKISEFASLWEANVYYRNILNNTFANLSFLGKLYWNGILVRNDRTITDCKCFLFRKNNDTSKVYRRASNGFNFEENSLLVLNDLAIKEPSHRHIEKFLANDPTITSVQVICPVDDNDIKNMNTKFNLDQLNPVKLSSVVKISKRKQSVYSERLIVYKYGSTWESIAYQSIDDDKKQKVLCRLDKQDKNYSFIVIDKKRIPSGIMQSLCNEFPNVSFYGVGFNISQERIDDDLSDFISINEFIENKVLNNKSIDFNKIKFASDSEYDINYSSIKMYVDLFSSLEKKINNKNSLFIENIKYILDIINIKRKQHGLLGLYETFNKPISDKEQSAWLMKNKIQSVSKINDSFDIKYPLLQELRYSGSHIVEPVAQYVNLIDSI